VRALPTTEAGLRCANGPMRAPFSTRESDEHAVIEDDDVVADRACRTIGSLRALCSPRRSTSSLPAALPGR
jgi:hypothetical protein